MTQNKLPNESRIGQAVRFFQRFTLAQRWEHTLLIISLSVLLLTGLPQKYRDTSWSQALLSTPEMVTNVQTVHHTAALVLTLEIVYHLANMVILMVRRRLPGDMLPTMQDVKDAFQMVKYLLFLSSEKPKFGKFNFEQKFTYWFLFFAIGILAFSGFVIWFPIQFTAIFPGGIIPAAKLAHSTEAIVTTLFVLIWHFYHVHLERLNLSIFTGKLNEEDMKNFHVLEYNRLTKTGAKKEVKGGKK